MAFKESAHGRACLRAALALLLFVVSVMPALASSLSVADAPTSVPLQTAVELQSERTDTSRTFRLDDGSLEARIYASPINYRDAEGDWLPIEEGLQEQKDGSGLINGSNSFSVELPEQLDAAPVRLSTDGEWLSSELLGANVDPVRLEDGSATYESPDGGVAFELTTIANGIKEDIEIESAAEPSTFHYALDASAGVAPHLLGDGSVEFRDAEHNVIGILPAPHMTDSAAPTPAVSHQASYYIQEAGDHWILTVDADRDWLTQSDRVWPVYIDPSIIKFETGSSFQQNKDCVFGGKKGSKNKATCGSNGYKDLWTAYWPKANSAEDEWSRLLLHFDLSNVPDDAYINSATLGLRASEAALNTSGVELGLVVKDVSYGQLSWTRYDQGALWTNEGGDYTSIVGAITTAERGTAAGWWKFPLTVKPILDFAYSIPPGGGQAPESVDFLTKLIDDKVRECTGGSCTQRQVKFESSAVTNPENRPYLSITYYPAAPATSKLISPNDGTQSARRFKLKAKWQAAGVTGVTFQYRRDTKEKFANIPESLVRDAQGKGVGQWPYAVSGVLESDPLYLDAAGIDPKYREEGGSLQIRAVFDASLSTSEGYSAPSKVTVNPNVGGTSDAAASVGPGTLNLLTGNLNVTRTDVSIPGVTSNLEFSRSHNSREPGAEADTSVLGRGWKPMAPVEVAGTGSWRSVREVAPSAEEAEEGFGGYAILIDLEGYEYAFEKEGTTYWAPPELSGWQLAGSTGTFTLSDPEGNRTTFSNGGSGSEYLPVAIALTGGSNNSTKFVYDVVNGKRRLKWLIAPSSEVTCGESVNTLEKPGCRVLVFGYLPATTWGAPVAYQDRLATITYYGPSGAKSMSQWDVAKYDYDSAGRLVATWDPRISPTLKEVYVYAGASSSHAGGQLKTITPPGQESWTLEYAPLVGEKAEAGRLRAVKRPSLVASPSIAQMTIAYEVPITGSGAPYEMGASTIAQWGQQDIPVDATAIFPPDQVPANSPSSYSRAGIYYLDADGRSVNVATPSGAGTSAPSITTIEYDEFGNVIRELTAQNRLRALAAGSGSVAKSHELETKRRYGQEGTQMEEEWGPMHEVRLESGSIVQARLHKTVGYDDGWKGTGVKPHLPTEEVMGASIVGQGVDADQRKTLIRYNWDLRKPTETVVDPQGLELKTIVAYNAETGLPTESRLPAGPNGGDAHTTKVTYYGGNQGTCQGKNGFSGLPCEIGPAAQPGTPGLPELTVRKIEAYSPMAQPTEVVESPGGKEATTRKTIMTYDTAGRPMSSKQVGGGTSLPPTATVYSTATGLPVEQKLTCETSCGGFDNQALVTTYDKLGRPVAYLDADGGLSETSYDLLGRPATVYDGIGSQTFGYDATSGLLTKLEDSAAGTFTAAYDADGNLTERGLPNGLLAKTTYDEAGAPTALNYTKVTNCSVNCTWLDFDAEESIYGQVLAQTSTLSSQQYSYDKAGRLTLVKDTPQGGSCATRQYFYDKDSNREKMTTREPGIGGACDTSSEGESQSYEYDAADRLIDEGISYDSFGRITSLPGVYAGGSTLTTTFYSNNMVASQSQGGLTNSYQLDAAGRPRQVVQTGTKTGTEVFHYAGGSDSPAWTERGETWTRSIAGIDGELAAIEDSSTETSLQLTNLHGDVVATASLSSTATGPTATFEFDEFGNPKQAGSQRFGWLGGKQRRTELPSGVIQMGVRSYVPAMGRFISVDPVMGGSANTYEYADGDPINGLDLFGTCSKRRCGRSSRYRGRPARGHASVTRARFSTGSGSAPHNLRVGPCWFNGAGIVRNQNNINAAKFAVNFGCSSSVKISAYIVGPGGPGPTGTGKGTSGVIGLHAVWPGPPRFPTLKICYLVDWQEDGDSRSRSACGVMIPGRRFVG